MDAFENMREVRLRGVRTQLVGATNEGNEVFLSISQGGLFTVVGLDGYNYQRNYQGFSIPYVYSYTDPNNIGTFKDVSEPEFPNLCTIKFGDTSPIAAPLRTPFGRWTVLNGDCFP